MQVSVSRSSVNTVVKVAVFRSGVWTPLNMIPQDEWGDEIEKEAMIFWSDGSWEYGIIRDEGKILFGNYDPEDEPQSERIYTIKDLVAV